LIEAPVDSTRTVERPSSASGLNRAQRLFAGWSANLFQIILGVTQQVALIPVFLHFWSGNVLAAWLAVYSVGNLVMIADGGLQFRVINRFLGFKSSADCDGRTAGFHAAMLRIYLWLAGSLTILLLIGTRFVSPAAVLGFQAIPDFDAAFVVMAAWRESDDQPQGRSPAAIVAGLWAALTVWAFVSASTTYVQYAKDGLDYIPPTEIPDDSATMQEKSFALVEKYPKDPRARMFRGLYFLDKQDLSDAEPYFREAVRLEEARPTMTRAFRDWNTALLAVTVFYEHRPDEARAIAAPLCGSSRVDARAQNVLDMGKLCAK